MNHAQHARARMVENQLLPGNLLDPCLLDAIAAVPRELFVPERLGSVAYLDEDIEIAEGRYMLEPLVFGRILAMAELRPNDRVLDLGSATGYSTAVIAHLAGDVTGVDNITDAELPARNLTKLGLSNAHFISAAPVKGYKEGAPYDVIFINGAVQEVPEAILAQLGMNGRLVAVENIAQRAGSASGLGRAMIMIKTPEALTCRYGFEANVPLLEDFGTKARFVF